MDIDHEYVSNHLQGSHRCDDAIVINDGTQRSAGNGRALTFEALVRFGDRYQH